MGYYTDYKLSWKIEDDADIDTDEAIRQWLDENNNDEQFYGVWPEGEAESCKWYNHEDDMKKLTNAFPHILFTLEGRGEESGDIWIKYFLGGKCQRAKARIVLDEFDPKKLERMP